MAACLVPTGLAAGYLVHRDHERQEEEIRRTTVTTARAITASVDRELASVQSGLRVLSSSRSLAAGDLATFHRRARDALRYQIVRNYILTDAAGRQVLNTLREYGEPLPDAGTPPELARVFTEGEPVLTGLFTGPVTREPVVAMGVPVYRDESIAYSLSVGLTPGQIAAILKPHAVPEGWIVGVIDRSGTIVARNREAARFVGQKAVPALLEAAAGRSEGSLETVTKDGTLVLSAFSRSPTSDWLVAVGAPKRVLVEGLLDSIALLLAGLLSTFGLSVGLASMLARRIDRSVASLIEPARQLGGGRAADVPTQSLREIEAVAAALREAGQRLTNAQHSATHDPLTGLANRALLEQFAPGVLGATSRRRGSVAVLAIDLDGFKQVNDLLGHAAGDRVLKIAAERLAGALRSSDVAARTGGDEFVVVLPDTDLAAARLVAEKLIETLGAPYPGVAPAVGASIGVAVASGADDERWTALLARADAALYGAKRAGKRRVGMAAARAATPAAAQATPA